MSLTPPVALARWGRRGVNTGPPAGEGQEPGAQQTACREAPKLPSCRGHAGLPRAGAGKLGFRRVWEAAAGTARAVSRPRRPGLCRVYVGHRQLASPASRFRGGSCDYRPELTAQPWNLHVALRPREAAGLCVSGVP